ncbi:MAG: hypothetical protein IPG12_17090 [Saprospiraceae bacterium]|nr:hypothetical protein [Saprospiraceae bacterium]
MENIRFGLNLFKPNTSVEPDVPWEDVMACSMNNMLHVGYFKNQKSSRKCVIKSEDLIWIEFRSNDWSWENFCGQGGDLSMCPNCGIQVEFILKL